MIPLRDSIRSQRIPYVTYAILGLNMAAFLAELTVGREAASVFEKFMVVPAAYSDGKTSLLWLLIPLVTSMFLHAGWFHLIGNMLFLWVFADNVEDRLGHLRFAVFYFACGLGAVLVQMLTDPSSGAHYLGASGAIGGDLGAYMITFPHARVLTLIPFYFLYFLEIPALIVLGFWFVTQLFNGVGALNPQLAGGIAYWAHVGGFLCGIALMLILAPRRGGSGGHVPNSAERKPLEEGGSRSDYQP